MPETIELLALAQRAKELAEKASPSPWLEPHSTNVLQLFSGRDSEANVAFVRFARTALPLLAEGVVELMRERELHKRLDEARANLPDWEKLWAEQSERAELAESRLAEVERIVSIQQSESESDLATIGKLLEKLKVTEAERDALREQLSREQEKIKRWIVTDHEKRSAAARKRAEEAALTPSPEETKT